MMQVCKLVGAILLTLVGGCAVAQNSASSHDPIGQGTIAATESGFTSHLPGAVPHRNRPYRGVPDLALPDPARDVVVIWNHGTYDASQYEACALDDNAPPESIRALTQAGIHIYFLCSRVRFLPRDGEEGTYVYRRADEIKVALDRFHDLGVSSDRLFLAGHSAGAWTSLMVARRYPELLNGVIAFAPAFARPRADIRMFPNWRKVARPKQVAELRQAKEMHALVFAYRHDAFNRPRELQFLPEAFPDTVELVAYSCDRENDHVSHRNDCRADDTARRIAAFVDRRLTARP